MKSEKIAVWVFGVLLSVAFVMSVAMLKDVNVKSTADVVDVVQTRATSSDFGRLRAEVKGSIYEVGENMTVFGACFDGDNYLIADGALNATFSSWYANGSQWELDKQMLPVLDGVNYTGRFRYNVSMPNVSGTYLTEMTCRYFGDTAVAFGEWQNPDWVARIKAEQDMLNVLNVSGLQNQTSYLQLYLEMTVFPLVNSTYAGVLDILAYLNIIGGQLNQTIEIANATLNVANATLQMASDTFQEVNGTGAKLDELLNRSNRIRAYVTQ